MIVNAGVLDVKLSLGSEESRVLIGGFLSVSLGGPTHYVDIANLLCINLVTT